MAAAGVWVAFDDDWTVFSIHSSEKAALREAVKRRQNVIFWRFGLTVQEALQEAGEADT